MKQRWLTLTSVVFLASACNQAPDDDPGSVSTPRTGDTERSRQLHPSDAETNPVRRSRKYELQGVLRRGREFQSRESCERARSAITAAQAKADDKRSEHGVLPPTRPMLACIPA